MGAATKGTRACSVCAALVFAFIAPRSAEARLESLKGFDEDLAKHGVTERYSATGMEALLALVRDEVDHVDGEIEKAEAEDRERLRAIAEAARGVLERAAAAPSPSEFSALKSFLYSLRAEVRGEKGTCLIADVLRLLGNTSLKVPYPSPEDRARPLGPDAAAEEAANLVDAKTGKKYGDPSELSGLSAEHVSRLDVSSDDYLWHDEATLAAIKARHGTAWKALEARTEARVAKALGARYSLSAARRILLFRGIRTTATSPKIDALDLQGQGWKVKWGEEVHTEPVANRLYAELGGKLADLVYANKGGPTDLVLVLDEAGAQEDERCASIVTFDDFKHCLRVSKYKFDVSAHVVGHGVITEAMLRQEPFATAAGPTAALVGREFVAFNESLVEFQSGTDGFEPLGAAPMSSTGARSHRAMRALAVFMYWIYNKDAKDANSKGTVDTGASTYVQYMHDMGAALGSLRYTGYLNRLKVGDAFVRRRGGHVKFESNMLYLPKAFKDATYADAMWMVRKIAGLSREEILAAVAASSWPDFQQDVLAGRLIARRNAIVHAFEAGPDMAVDTAPTVVSLRTRADRLAAVERYDLAIATGGDAEKAVALLEEFMASSGIEWTDGVADFEDRLTETRADVLATTDCQESVLVAWLERTIHPAGLSRRLYRRSDDRPLKACQPTRRSLRR